MNVPLALRPDGLTARHLVVGLLLGMANAAPVGSQAGGASGPPREGFIAAADGAKLYYVIVGTGPDTVFIPLAVYLTAEFAPLLPGRTAVFYDPRGRGRSEPLIDARLGFFKDVGDVEAVRDGLKIGRMSLIGWSYLGAVATTYATLHPKNVVRIVLVGPSAVRSGDNWSDPRRFVTQVDSASLRALESMRGALRTTDDSLAYCRLDLRARTLPRLMADTAAIARMRADPCLLENERPERWRRTLHLAIAGLGTTFDLRPRAAQVHLPVLIVWGDRDPGPEAATREWLTAFPDARLLVVHDAGHLPWLEHGEVVFPAIDEFLRGKWPLAAEAAGRDH